MPVHQKEVLVVEALKYTAEQNSTKKIVTFACDTGNKYLTKMYSNGGMREKKFIIRQKEHYNL